MQMNNVYSFSVKCTKISVQSAVLKGPFYAKIHFYMVFEDKCELAVYSM